MPCILKQRTPSSPGIVVFTSNEAVRGLPARSKSVKSYLLSTSANGSWLYGVHVQGDFSQQQWELEEWQSFVMWPDIEAPFLGSVPASKLVSLNCINFMPHIEPARQYLHNKSWDICIISRPSKIKRISETLHIMRKLLDARPALTFILIVHVRLHMGNV